MIPKHIKKILSGIYDVLTLEDLFPHRIRRIIFQMFGSASLILIIVLVFGGESTDPNIRGGAFVCLAITLFLFTLEAYFYSVVVDSRTKFFVSFDVGLLLYYADDDDLTASLLFSDLGDAGMKRLGYTEAEIKDFLVLRNHTPFVGVFDSVTNHIYAEEYFKLIYENDNDLRDFLSKRDINRDEFVGAMVWEVQKNRKVIESERFWSKDNLSRITGIGKSWSYGGTYTLQKYGQDLTENAEEFDPVYAKSKEKIVTNLESILAKDNGSNVIVISDDSSSRLDVMVMLSELIAKGKSLLKLQHKRVFLINPNLITSLIHDKKSFEKELVLILEEAEKAQNIILVIPDISLFIKSATNIGVDMSAIIVPLIHSPHIHIVGLDSKNEYYSFLSHKSSITENFEILTTDNGDDSSLLAMLVEEAEKVEKANKISITYPALLAIVKLIKNRVKEDIKATKCKDILVESTSLVQKQGRSMVLKSDIVSVTDFDR